MPLITDPKGLWRRSVIAYPDGRRDTTTRVHWLQVEPCDPERGTRAFLVRVGSAIMYARDRATPLTAHRTLVEYLNGAFSLTSARGMLGQHGVQHGLTTQDRGSGGATVSRAWDMIEIEGNAGALLHIA